MDTQLSWMEEAKSMLEILMDVLVRIGKGCVHIVLERSAAQTNPGLQCSEENCRGENSFSRVI